MTRSTPKPEETRGPSRDLEPVKVMNFARTPSKYTETIPHQIFVMAGLGLTQAQMADSLGVSHATVANWLENRQECRQAYDEGKYSADFDVALALKRKATGYEYERTKIYTGVDSTGRPWSREVTETVRVEGDVTAQKFWLSNRQPEMWREASAQQHGTNIQVNNINFDLFDEDEKKLARSMAIKQLEGTNVIAGN